MWRLCCKSKDKKNTPENEAKGDGKEKENKEERPLHGRGHGDKAPSSPNETDTSENDNIKNSKKMSPDEHSDSHSDTTDSDSSDSSDDGAKRSKHGNVTVYKSSKTFVKGNKYKIDNKNGNLAIGKIENQTVIHQEKVQLFKKAGFDAKNASIMEGKIWASSSASDCGSFINTRDRDLVMDYVFNLQVRADASAGVGILKFGRTSATCFRVGANKIMTALQVIKAFVDLDYRPVHSIHWKRPSEMFSSVHQASGDTETDGAQGSDHDRDVLLTLVDAFVDFKYLRRDYQFLDRNRFKLKPLTSVGDIPFFDEATDCIVLELLVNDQGPPMPYSFTSFSIPQFDGSFHLIGHPEGKQKHVDKVSIMLDLTKENTQADIKIVREKSNDFIHGKGKSVREFQYDYTGNARVDNPDRFLFHCCLRKGASGSPGVMVQDDGSIVVVTMLLHGYPDWYYSEKSNLFREGWPQEYCVEQGANMKSVYDKMSSVNRTLCVEIFHNQ